MYDVFRFPSSKLFGHSACFVLCCLVSFQVKAFSAGPYELSTSGNVYTLQGAVLNKTNGAGITYGVGSNGQITASGPVRFSPAGIPSVDASVRAGVSGSSVAKAVGRVLTKTIGPAALAIALVDLSRELGFNFNRSTDGAVVVTKTNDGTGYTVSCQAGTITRPSVASLQLECGAALQSYWRVNGYPQCSYAYPVPGDLNFRLAYLTSCGGYPSFVATLVSTGPIESPSSIVELEQAIANKSGWPSTSVVSRAVDSLIQSGESVEAVPESITGPATTPGTKTTVRNADGSTTITNTTNNYDYSDRSVTVTNRTVVTNTTLDGVTTTSTDATTEPEKKEDECEKNPDRVGCLNLDIPEGEIPKATKNIAYQPESYFGGGSCPADKFLNVRGQQIKVIDWVANCGYLSNVFKPILLFMCAFVALMILSSGVKT